MSEQEAIEISFAECAEAVGDIQPAVFERFFADSPAAQDLMSHTDQHMRGRMLDEVLRLLMSEDEEELNAYLGWELANHRLAYSVQDSMYGDLFTAVRDVVRHSIGDGWTPVTESAWGKRLNRLLTAIDLAGGQSAA